MRRFDPVKHLERLESPRRYRRQPPELILPFLPPIPGGVLVDLGCGTGFFGRTLARRHIHGLYLGMDPSPEMLGRFASSLGAAGLETVNLARMERERLPLRSGSVELIFLGNVLHELLSDAGVLPEIARVLSPGGMVFVVDWKKRPSPLGPPVFLRVSRRRAVRIFEDMGFRPVLLPGLYRRHYCLLFVKEEGGGRR